VHEKRRKRNKTCVALQFTANRREYRRVDTSARAWIRDYTASRPRVAKKPCCRPGIVSKHRRIYRVSHCSFAFVCSLLLSSPFAASVLSVSLSLSSFVPSSLPSRPLYLFVICDLPLAISLGAIPDPDLRGNNRESTQSNIRSFRKRILSFCMSESFLP